MALANNSARRRTGFASLIAYRTVTSATAGREARVDSRIELAIAFAALGLAQRRFGVAHAVRATWTGCGAIRLPRATRVDPELASTSATAEDTARAVWVGDPAHLTAWIIGSTTTLECPGGDAHVALRARARCVLRAVRLRTVTPANAATSDAQSWCDQHRCSEPEPAHYTSHLSFVMRSITTRTFGGGAYAAQARDNVKPTSASGPPQGRRFSVFQALAWVKAPSGWGSAARSA